MSKIPPSKLAVPPAGERLIDIISIQSQVAWGNVGNNIAVQVLQALGLQVAPVPTVVLSNAPHYPSMHGGPVPLDWFEGILDDLEARQVATRALRVQVGYLGSPAQGRVLAGWLDRMQALNPHLQVQIDPVMGDHDSGLYTDPALLPVWRDHLLSRAQGLTPNHFELEQLTGRTLCTLDDCIEAAQGLLGGRTEWVVVTSAAPSECTPGRVTLALVTAAGHEVMEHDAIDHPVKGVGDLFAALISGRVMGGLTLDGAVRRACDDVVAVLRDGKARGWQELALPAEIAKRW